MITPLNRLNYAPTTPQQALEFLHVADLAGQLVLSQAATLEQLAGDQTEAGIIALFADMRARERAPSTQYGSRNLSMAEAFEIAFIGSLG